MENNINNRERFFAQYWGQHLGCNNFGTSGIQLNYVIFQNVKFLQLKPLSSITETDATEIALMCSIRIDYLMPKGALSTGRMPMDRLKESIGRRLKISDWNCEQYQYLQSKGYALPYMGLSVEKLVQYGWIKLNV